MVGLDDYRSQVGFNDLVYLSTATMGPTLNRCLVETLKQWISLEEDPHQRGYNDLVGAMNSVRKKGADILNCKRIELSHAHSTTDAMNTIAQSIRFKNDDCIITTNQEHAGGRRCWDHVKANQCDVSIEVIPLTLALHDRAAIVELFRDAIVECDKKGQRVRVISISHVLAPNGLVMPVREIAQMRREHKHSADSLYVVDGAQALGAIKVDVAHLEVDAYAACGHKWVMGPKGSGLLYLRRGSDFVLPTRLVDGPKSYCGAGGVPNIPSILGFGSALDHLVESTIDRISSYNRILRMQAEEGLRGVHGLEIVSPPLSQDGTSILTVRLPHAISSEAFCAKLHAEHRIRVKHWSEGDWGDRSEREHCVRISPHVFNSEDEIDHAIAAFDAVLSQRPL